MSISVKGCELFDEKAAHCLVCSVTHGEKSFRGRMKRLYCTALRCKLDGIEYYYYTPCGAKVNLEVSSKFSKLTWDDEFILDHYDEFVNDSRFMDLTYSWNDILEDIFDEEWYQDHRNPVEVELNSALISMFDKPRTAEAEAAVTDFIRMRMSEEGFTRQIIPPLKITDDDLAKQVDTDKPVVICEKDSVAPHSPFPIAPIKRHIGKVTITVSFKKIEKRGESIE
jgi:hypothetical protein